MDRHTNKEDHRGGFAPKKILRHVVKNVVHFHVKYLLMLLKGEAHFKTFFADSDAEYVVVT